MIFQLLGLLAIALSALAVDDVEEPALRFLLLGDWGKGGSTGAYGSSMANDSLALLANENKNNNNNNNKKVFYQVPVAAAMGRYAAIAQPSFVLALGDNFYSNGVSSSTDVLWNYLWKDVYLPYASLTIPWYPVFGNHDYGGGAAYVKAQLQRTQEHLDDDVWQFEASNYTKTFAIPSPSSPAPEGTATVQIVFIDTTTLAPSVNKCCNENGGVSKEVQAERIADQLSRITAVLEETQTNPPTWLLVVGHYPVYSAGPNGDIAELQTYLLPLLVKYKVHAYICGHDHISEHLQAEGIEFFVAGAGSMTDKLGSAGSKGALIWYGVGYSAFGAVTATASALTVSFININDSMTYNYTLTNPNPSVWGPRPVDPRPDPVDDGDQGPKGNDQQQAKELRLLTSGMVVFGMLGFFMYFFYGGKATFRKKVPVPGQAEEEGEAQKVVMAKKRSVAGKPRSYAQLLQCLDDCSGSSDGDLRRLEEGTRSSLFAIAGKSTRTRHTQQTVDTSDEDEEKMCDEGDAQPLSVDTKASPATQPNTAEASSPGDIAQVASSPFCGDIAYSRLHPGPAFSSTASSPRPSPSRGPDSGGHRRTHTTPM